MASDTERSRLKRLLIDAAAITLIIASPVIGLVPGPGGILLLLGGFSLLASNHHWARQFLLYLEKHRSDFVDSMLADRKISIAADIVAIAAIAGGASIIFVADNYLVRGIGLGMVSASLILLLSNKKRLEKLVRKLKR